MHTLELLYETTHKNTLFIDRKVAITHPKTLLYGPRKSGKTHLIIDHLSQYEKGSYLYIDLSDMRIDTQEIEEALHAFVAAHPIRLLVIEHYDFHLSLPDVPEIILTTPFTCKTLEGFESCTLYPLDFEEFIAFHKKFANIEHLFNLFANHGTFPSIVQSVENTHHRQMQSLLKELCEDAQSLAIYRRFCELQSSKLSLYQVFTHLKSSIKLSKDKLYAITQNLQDQQLLFMVEKFGQPTALKKVYLIDFALKNALTFKKDFLKRFENMLFLELIKRGKKVYYEEGIDFYLPEEDLAIVCVGFMTSSAIETKLQKLLPRFWALHVKRVEVVTLSSESALFDEAMSFTILPFWEWALQLTE